MSLSPSLAAPNSAARSAPTTHLQAHAHHVHALICVAAQPLVHAARGGARGVDIPCAHQHTQRVAAQAEARTLLRNKQRQEHQQQRLQADVQGILGRAQLRSGKNKG